MEVKRWYQIEDGVGALCWVSEDVWIEAGKPFFFDYFEEENKKEEAMDKKEMIDTIKNGLIEAMDTIEYNASIANRFYKLLKDMDPETADIFKDRMEKINDVEELLS